MKKIAHFLTGFLLFLVYLPKMIVAGIIILSYLVITKDVLNKKVNYITK